VIIAILLYILIGCALGIIWVSYDTKIPMYGWDAAALVLLLWPFSLLFALVTRCVARNEEE